METTASIYSELISPHPALSPFIATYLYNEIKVITPSNLDLFPVGHCVISFALDELPLHLEGKQVVSKFNITGQLTRHYQMTTVPGLYRTIMVVFKPAGAHRLLGVHQHSLADKYTDMLSLFPDLQNIYSTVIDNNAHPKTGIEHIEQWFLARLATTAPTHKYEQIVQVVAKMMENKGSVQLKEIYLQSGMSKTTLERHFKEKIGLNPKLFNRIIRFNEAYKAISATNFENWQDIVEQYGYFDQAHFIKEFKTFYGFLPTQLHKSEISVAGHVRELAG